MTAEIRRRWPVMLISAVVLWLAASPTAVGLGVRPVDGRVVRTFDPPEQRWLPGHRGIDLQASAGAVVRAVADGRIGFAGEVAGKPVVTVLHDGVRTTYEPVRATVSVGDRVRAGDVIGHLVEGHACGGGVASCLHLGLLRGDVYMDPMLLFENPPIRLLSEADAHAIAGRR